MENTNTISPQAALLLNNLITNLSGEHGDYWLGALDKMLLKDTIPEPPAEVLEFLIKERLDSGKKARAQIKKFVKWLNSIPAVHKATIIEPDNTNDFGLVDIELYPSLASFIDKNKACIDLALFTIHSSKSIREVDSNYISDEIFDLWETKADTVENFCQDLINLSKLYQEEVNKITR